MVIEMAVVFDSRMDLARWSVDNDVVFWDFKAYANIKFVNGCKNVYLVCDEIGYRGYGDTAFEYYGLDYSDYDILRDVFGGYLSAMVIEAVPQFDTNGSSAYRVIGF